LSGSPTYSGTSQGAKNFGDYTIAPGGFSSGNYQITYESADLKILKAPLAITANDDSKEYDGIPYQGGSGVTYSGFVNGETEAVLDGELSYEGSSQDAVAVDTDEHYDIYPAGLTAQNYEIKFLHGHLTIYPRAITVIADAVSKVYGGSEPALTYKVTSGSLAGGQSFSGSLTRVSGENVGSYPIKQGSLAVNPNYAITFVGADLVVNPKQLTVQLTGTLSKVYDGTATADLAAGNFTLSGLVNSDAVVLNHPASGTFSDANVGTGKQVQVAGISISGPAASNYFLASGDVDGNVGEITPKTITVTAVAASKVYGDDDPELMYAYTGALEASDVFSGELERAPGEAAGTYAVNQGTLVISSNYTLSFVPAELTITPKVLTAALTGSVSKIYDGTVTAALLAGYFNLGGVLGTDDVQLNFPATGVYDTKAVGSGKVVSVSGLSITGAAAGNYALASPFISGAVGEILGRAVTASLIGNVGKEYDGTIDAILQSENYDLAGVLPGDLADVSLITSGYGSYDTREKGTGKTVTATGLTLAGPGAGNYVLASTSVSNSIGEIKAKPVTAALSGSVVKVYDGTDHAALDASVYQLTGVLAADQADVFLNNPGSGRYDSKDTGTGKIVTVGGLSISGPGAGNYHIISTTISGPVGEISPREISVTAISRNKVYGSADPAFDYDITSGSVVSGDDFTGSLERLAGEDTGTYPVSQGSLALGSNYSVSFTGGALTIKPATLTVRADDKIRPYNTANPALTYSYAGLVNGDNEADAVFAAPLVTTTATVASPAGIYPIVVSGGTFSANYLVSYLDGGLTVGSTKPVISFTDMARSYGNPDFDPAAHSSSPVAIIYSSDNEAVAKIIDNRIHIVGAGSANITASQAADGNYEEADPVTKVLKVEKAVLVVTARDDAKIYDGVSYSGGNGVTYTGFVNGEDERQLQGDLEYGGSSQGAVNVDTEDHYDI
ncbi:MAG TPA: MBG domain-containing protein, partial [Sphingobacteriaceae bacterium]